MGARAATNQKLTVLDGSAATNQRLTVSYYVEATTNHRPTVLAVTNACRQTKPFILGGTKSSHLGHLCILNVEAITVTMHHIDE